MKPGARVGVIRSEEGGKVFVYGFGVYEGDSEPESVYGMSRTELKDYIESQAPGITQKDLAKVVDKAFRNPRIKLDNGKTVWGFECWWDDEDSVKASLANKEVIYVDIDQDREGLQ